MKRYNEVSNNADLYARINAMSISAHERAVAIRALQNADAISDAILWVTHGLKKLGTRLFAKPAALHA